MSCGNFSDICLFGSIPTVGTFRQLNAEEVEGTGAAEGTAAVEEEGLAATELL